MDSNIMLYFGYGKSYIVIAKARDLSRAQPGQDELLAREPIEGAAEHGNEE